MSQYPECEKMAAVRDQSQTIGEFLEWLNNKGVFLTKNEGTFFQQNTVTQSTEQMLAEYFGIDLKVVEQEKRAMLDGFRQRQGIPS